MITRAGYRTPAMLAPLTRDGVTVGERIHDLHAFVVNILAGWCGDGGDVARGCRWHGTLGRRGQQGTFLLYPGQFGFQVANSPLEAEKI